MTDTDTRTSFLGVPVNGDPTDARRHTTQRPVEELAPIMQAVLNDPYFVSFGWVQYTPYFNDGDLCEFGVHTFWIKTRDDVRDMSRQAVDARYEALLTHLQALSEAGVIDPADWDDLVEKAKESAEEPENSDGDGEDNYKYEVGYGSHPSLGGMTGYRDDAEYKGDQYEKWTMARDLSNAIVGGEFEDVLLLQFGDHAEVTWSRDGGVFDIEEYSHD